MYIVRYFVPLLQEAPEPHRGRPRVMSQSSVAPELQAFQEPSALQTSPPAPPHEQDPRNRNFHPSNHDDRSHPHSDFFYASKRDCDRLRSERDASRNQCVKLEEGRVWLEDKNRKLEQEARFYEKEMKGREEVLQLKGELMRMYERERGKNEELRAVGQRLALEGMQHEETKRLLKMKVDELDGMQVFTRKADQVSVADVIGLVKALNAEILQASAFISDPQHLSFSQDQATDQEVSKAVEAVRNSLGEEIAQAIQDLGDLRKELHPEDPTAVQHALQIAMTAFCEKMINAWTPVWDANEWLNQTYERIRATESQAVAGRWRALTRAQVDAKNPRFIMESLIYQVVDVLVAVGSQIHADRLRETFQEHLSAIVDNVVRVERAAGESVTSMDVMPYSCPPGMGFIKELMTDMYGSSSTEGAGKNVILGTTELGLWRREKTTVMGRTEDQCTPLLLAKVVLESALRE